VNNRPWLFKKGQSGNPNGRPAGAKSRRLAELEIAKREAAAVAILANDDDPAVFHGDALDLLRKVYLSPQFTWDVRLEEAEIS
jgi:hypothetical protein